MMTMLNMYLEVRCPSSFCKVMHHFFKFAQRSLMVNKETQTHFMLIHLFFFKYYKHHTVSFHVQFSVLLFLTVLFRVLSQSGSIQQSTDVNFMSDSGLGHKITEWKDGTPKLWYAESQQWHSTIHIWTLFCSLLPTWHSKNKLGQRCSVNCWLTFLRTWDKHIFLLYQIQFYWSILWKSHLQSKWKRILWIYSKRGHVTVDLKPLTPTVHVSCL